MSSFSSTSSAFIASDEKQKILAEEEAALNHFREQKGGTHLSLLKCYSRNCRNVSCIFKLLVSVPDVPGGVPSATNPFLSGVAQAPPQTSQTQQILDLFSSPGQPAQAAPQQPAAAAAGGGSALDDLLSLGIGGGGAANGTAAAPPVQTSNPFADMFSASPAAPMQQQQKVGFGGNGYAPVGMGAGMPMGMGAQPQFYQQPPMIQQPYGGANNMNNVFGTNNEQGKN